MADIAKITDAQKRLQGSSRYVKNSPVSKPVAKLWNAPKGMGPKARGYFSSIGRELVKAGVLTQMDRPQFEELCMLYQTVCDLRELLKEDGYVIRDSNGKPSRHPASVLYRDTLASFINLSQRFGLTPYDRKRIDLPVDKNTKDASREFLGL